MIELTDTQVLQGLQELVDEKGEGFVYEKRERVEGLAPKRCVYVHQGEPDCLVGQFLAKAGIPLDRLEAADVDNYNQGTAASELVDKLKAEGLLKVSDRALRALSFAQSEQDSGETWGEALREAKRQLDF